MTIDEERSLIHEATMKELEKKYFDEGWDEEGMTLAEFVTILKFNGCKIIES